MTDSWLDKFVCERWVAGGILAAGAVERFVWVANSQNIKPVISESHNVAVSLASTGRFANTFAADSGPTAHVGMLTPLPSAAAYWLFGADTRLAELGITAWAIGLVCLGLWLCWRLACVLEMPPAARIIALAFVSLIPLQFGLEIREGRNWEVNLAVVLLLWVLLRLAGSDKAQSIRSHELAITGLICGFLFILSPPAGLAACLAFGLFEILRLPLSRWWIGPIACAVVVASLGGAWAERNWVVLGEAIPLRDNFGLEFDLSNYSGAVHPADARTAYLARMHDIHPLIGTALGRLRAAGGEVPYYHRLGAEADAWVAAHPAAFLYLTARRFVQFYLPPKWFWFTFGAEGKIVWLRQFLVWATALAGFCTLGFMARRKRTYLYVLLATLACSAPYVLVQPTLRYRYLVSSLLIFLAFDGVFRLAQYLRARPPATRIPAAS